ncbi:MAG: GNAT family N-acetyltransferase [Phycisphaerales bacterium]|jgi:predicted GNAT family N-acyltransferase|nr:GNAT family N-acetyltransferase [Phycisphaerales bacterium]
MLIEEVTAQDCYNLRESILRPGQPKENWTFEADDDPKTIHLAAKLNGTIVGIVSLLPEDNNEVFNHPWRLRGMAVLEKYRGQGVGKKLLLELLNRVDEGIWCTARKHIAGFYSKNGFEIIGEEFTMNDMPHVYMRT